MVILFGINAPLALLGMLPIPLIILTMQAYDKFVRPAFRARQRKLGELNATLNDNLSGVREIMAFTREEAESLKVADYINDYRLTNLHALRLMATFHPLVQFASSLGSIILIYFGGKFVLARRWGSIRWWLFSCISKRSTSPSAS